MGVISDILFGRNRTPGSLATWQSDTPPLTIQTVTLENLFPGIEADELPMFRLEAQTIPAVMAIQNLLTAAVGPLILQAVLSSDGETLTATQPSWITRTDRGAQNPLLRMSRTVKDLYYSGVALWTKDAKDGKGFPLSMSHIPIERWSYEDDGSVTIDGAPVDFSDIVIFEGTFEGILIVGGRTLRTARDIERTIRARARVAMPTQALRNLDTTGQSEPDEDELQTMLQDYSDARRATNGAVVYVPGNYQLENLEDNPNNWLLEARSAVVADMAKITGIPSGLIEGAQFGSLNYSTELGQLSRFTDFNIKNFTDPITSRLSMGDVTPRGTAVRFDLSVLDQEAPEPLTDKGAPVAPNTAAPEASTAND